MSYISSSLKSTEIPIEMLMAHLGSTWKRTHAKTDVPLPDAWIETSALPWSTDVSFQGHMASLATQRHWHADKRWADYPDNSSEKREWVGDSIKLGFLMEILLYN